MKQMIAFLKVSRVYLFLVFLKVSLITFYLLFLITMRQYMSVEMSQWSFKLSYYNEHKSYLRHVNVDNKY